MGFTYNNPAALIGTLADGTTLTTGNSAGAAGTAFTSFAGAGNTFVGGKHRFNAAGGSATYCTRSISATTFGFEVLVDGFRPSGGQARIFQVASSAGTIVKLEIGTDGTAYLYDLSGLVFHSTAAIPTAGSGSTRFFVGGVVNGSGASTLTCYMYSGSGGTSATVDMGGSYSAATVNLGSAATTTWTMGKVNTTPTADLYLSEYQFHDSMATALGRFSPAPVIGTPALIIGSDFTGQVTSYKTVTLTSVEYLSGEDMGDSIIDTSSYRAHIESPTAGAATYRYTFTDSVGQVTTTDVAYDTASTSDNLTGRRRYMWDENKSGGAGWV